MIFSLLTFPDLRFSVNKKISYAGSYEEKTDKQDSFGDDLDRQVVDRQRERNTQFDDLHGNFKSRISQLIVNGRKRDLGQFNRQENFTSATRRELRVDRSTVPQSAILVLVSNPPSIIIKYHTEIRRN